MSTARLLLPVAAMLAVAAGVSAAEVVTTTTTTTTAASNQWVPGHFEYDAWGNGAYVAGHWMTVPGSTQTVVTQSVPAAQNTVTYAQSAPQVVYAEPACAPSTSVVIGVGAGYGYYHGYNHGYDHGGHDRGWGWGPILPIPILLPFPFFFHHH